jgi:UDP-glucose 4-epimerase
MAAIDYLAQGGQTSAMNLGTGVGSSVLEVLQAIERIAGKPVPYDIVGRRAGDPVSIFSEPTFARSTLGWEPKYGLDEIIETAYRWHLEQLG